MSAAAPTTPATNLPDDLADRQAELNKRTGPALKAAALKAGIEIPVGPKSTLVAEFSKNDDFMRTYGWSALEPETPAASTGNVDEHGDIIGATTEDPYDCDEDGFPADRADVAKLDQEHVQALVFWLETNTPSLSAPVFPGADEMVAWVVANGYEDEAETPVEQAVRAGIIDAESAAVIGDDPAIVDLAAGTLTVHIPTASPAPTTVTTDELQRINADKEGANAPEACECNGSGGFETDAGWEKCTKCDGAVEDNGQLTLVPGGDAPVKSILNVASLRHDLGSATEFKDGDRVRVTFEVEVDKIAFIPEKSGGESKRRIRTHAGAIDLETVEVELAS